MYCVQVRYIGIAARKTRVYLYIELVRCEYGDKRDSVSSKQAKALNAGPAD